MAKRHNKKYPVANRDFLSSMETESDTHKLDKGVLYKIIKSGDGDRTPLLSSVVSVHYRGTLISSREFDTTYGNGYPETFYLREVIEGWQIALSSMVIGDKWSVYIPSDLGYGDRNSDSIPGGSTLIFEIELLAIS
jgi:peptidylprolyl isomerase